MDTRWINQELIARAILLLIVASVIYGISMRFTNQPDVIVLEGNMPEVGGWHPEVIRARAGEPLHLRFTSNDVVHGFAIGQMEGMAVDVYPGQYSEMEITFEHPGTYTYYCTRWCGPNHWRMRGTIEVEGDNDPVVEGSTEPLYLQLGIDIDSHHEAENLPLSPPSAIRGAALDVSIPEAYLDSSYYLSHSPSDFFEDLRNEQSLENFADAQLWDLIATAYWANTTEEQVLEGDKLFSENCAACHGENGEGNGVFAEAEALTEPPTDFSDREHMLGANPALLQGKIIRGGMGTGMPYWGSIFTEEQTWSLVSYLWSFQFDFPTED
jgi:mono/diheme cytochrome c family protein/plastocyanin